MASVCRDITALSENAELACRKFLEVCEREGLMVRITETYRSQERQNELYAQGRTKAGEIVTWTKNSRHTSRRAWDICQNIKGKEYDTSTGFFTSCGAVAKRLGITWGGTWKTPDQPHFEVESDWDFAKTEEGKKMQEIESLKKRVSELEEGLKVYDKIDSAMPDWIKTVTEWGLENGIIRGTGSGLGMTKAKAETLAMIKNALAE